MAFVKGMVQVGGKTYRIVRLGRGRYEVIRILDDAKVGTFATEPKLQVTSNHIDSALVNEIARSALMGGKLSWVGRLFSQKR
ncbi:MAG TPA: hypothetical protein VF881_15080 [Polyangiaceae bacterium]